MFHLLSTLPELTLPVRTVLFINQIERTPEVFCQRMSCCPSPLKSLIPKSRSMMSPRSPE